MPNISLSQARSLISYRELDETSRKRHKAALFAAIKREHGIPKTTKIKIEIDNQSSPSYCVIKDAETGLAWGNGSAAPGPRPQVRLSVPEWAEPQVGREVAQAIARSNPQAKPAPAGIGEPAMPGSRYAGVPNATAPALKVGSISIEDALRLLRLDADTAESFAAVEQTTSSELFVQHDRLFFVL